MRLGNSIISGDIASVDTAAQSRSSSAPSPRTSFNFTRTLDAGVVFLRVQIRNNTRLMLQQMTTILK